jgi:hypothetical protein
MLSTSPVAPEKPAPLEALLSPTEEEAAAVSAAAAAVPFMSAALGVESPPSSPELLLLPKERPRGARKGRQCDACHTTETPMWRRGGKGTLCNACGVRWSLRKKRPPRPGFEGEAGGEVLSPLSELSDDPAAGTMLDDEATDPAIAALRSKRESDKQDYYYCRYCDKTWPLNYFRNSQQFGAHCSNCSRKKRPSPNGEPEMAVKPKRERRERKKVKREPIPAGPFWSSESQGNASPAAARAPAVSPLSSTSTSPASESRKRDRDHSGGEGGGGAMTKRRSKHHRHNRDQNHHSVVRSKSSGSSSGGDSDGEGDDGAWERLFQKLKGNSAKQVTVEPPPRVLGEEERRREVDLLEKEVTLLRYQVRLKEHWHKKSLKEVKHNMEEELHELQKDLIYSFEVAQACIKLELESNEKEETQVLLAFARQVSLPPTPQPQSPQHHTPPPPAGSDTGSTSSGACTPCHENLDKLRQDGEQLRRSCNQQLAKLKTELEQQFNAKEETFMRMLGETKTHFGASTQRLRKKISEIESIIRTLRTSASDAASPPAHQALSASMCP